MVDQSRAGVSSWDTWHNDRMVQESLSRGERELRAGDELAERLDALSRPLAERVLGRAIELDHEQATSAAAAADSIDYEMLKEIALEVGISEDALRRALLEEIDTDKDHAPRPIERVTVPDSVRGGLIVPGTAEEIGRRLRDYLERIEGLSETGSSGDQSVWTRKARNPRGAVTARTVPQSRPDRQLVEIDITTRSARKTAWRWVIGLLILAVLFNGPIGGFIMLGLFVAGVATVVSWVKRIGRMARRSINRTLYSLTDRDDEPPDRWLDVWERTSR